MTIDKPAFKGDDYDFALGSIKGMRSWQIDEKGRLRGITHPAVWLPGDNVSVCKVKVRCPVSPVNDYSFVEWRVEPTLGPRALMKPCDIKGCEGGYHPPSHTFDPDCECGFWAYDEVGYKPHGQVTGIIEGFGRTTIGTKGFRAEKAKVVALARENDEGMLTLSEWLRLKELYPAATFHDDTDDMVLAHGQVLRTWPEVDADFWTEEPEPRSRFDSYQAQIQKLQAQISSMYGVPSSTFLSSTPRRSGSTFFRGLLP